MSCLLLVCICPHVFKQTSHKLCEQICSPTVYPLFTHFYVTALGDLWDSGKQSTTTNSLSELLLLRRNQSQCLLAWLNNILVSMSFWHPYNSAHTHTHTHVSTTSWVLVCPDVSWISARMTSAYSWGERGHFHSDELGQTAPAFRYVPAAAGWHTLKVWCLLQPRPPGRDRNKGGEFRLK